MSDQYSYDAPINFERALAEARSRAASDACFASALRCMINVYEPRYAHGVLATLGLDRLGSDYVQAIGYVDRLVDELPDSPQTDAEAVDRFFGLTPPSRELEKARAHLQSERQRLSKISRLVEMIARAGETIDYDGAPS